jgi:hypothetical protein
VQTIAARPVPISNQLLLPERRIAAGVVSRRPITTLLTQPRAEVTASDAERVIADPRRGETSIVR